MIKLPTFAEQPKRIILALVACPLAFFVVFWLVGREGLQYARPFQRSDQTYLASWRQTKLTAITATSDFKAKVMRCPLVSTTPLTTTQSNTLHVAAYNFLQAYSSGAFETYARFRFPTTDGTYNPTLLAFDLKLLAEHGENVATNPVDAIALFKTLWQGGGRPLCTNCWERAGIDDLKIVIKRTPYIPSLKMVTDLTMYHPPADTTSLLGYEPRFLFDPSPAELIAAQGTTTHAFLWVIVRDRSDSQPYPVYCQWYWSDSHEDWLPLSVGNGDVRDAPHPLLF